jgi:Cytochrome c554 and c-prime
MGRPSIRATIAVAAAALILNVGVVLSGQLATADRVAAPGWWPTKGSVPRADYVGAAACAPCHGGQTASQPATAMARTAMAADRSGVLQKAGRLTFQSGRYSYQIVSDGRQSLYTVSDGEHSSSAPLGWAFGLGNVGQSFLFERDGVFHEARVSYYEAVHGLGFTPGRALTHARDVAEAMARPVDAAETRRCFGCHTTAPTADGAFSASKAIGGITCEACHGPGRRHVEAMAQPPSVARDSAILNPAKLKPEESVDFCGSCHATFWDVTLAQETGISAMRSQPYRLQSSRCWKSADARLTCVACHDPHRPLVTSAAAYDDRCLACHVTAGAQRTSTHPGRACPVGTARCAECHMPKYEVPDMHHEFTDHRIQLPRRAVSP